MTDETNSLRADLEAAWDSLAAEETDPAEEAEPGAEAEPGEAAPAEPADDADAGPPPEHWPAAWRERFLALPEDAREYALDLHRELETAHSERAQTLAERERALAGLEAVDAALAPWREAMRAQGISDGEAVARLLEAHALIEQDPEAALALFAETYGLAPAGDAPPAAPGTPARPDETLDTLERYAAEQHELRLLAAMEAELDARARAPTPTAGRASRISTRSGPGSRR